MKVFVVRNRKDHSLCMVSMTMERLLERMAKDDAKGTVAKFREMVPFLEGDYEHYVGMGTWRHVCPVANFTQDANGNMVYQKLTGLVLLTLGNMLAPGLIAETKLRVASLPMTYAAFVGADGRSLHVLVKVLLDEEENPRNEVEANRWYEAAYQQVKTVYEPMVPDGVVWQSTPSVRESFLFTWDASPCLHLQPASMKMVASSVAYRLVSKDKGAESAYGDNDFLYKKALDEVLEEMAQKKIVWKNEETERKAQISAVAERLCRMGMPEEEALEHVRMHCWRQLSPDEMAWVVSTAYQKAAHGKRACNVGQVRARILDMQNYIEKHYVLRYNQVAKRTEFRPNNSHVEMFVPVDARVQKRMALEVQLADIKVSIKDVRNFLESDCIKSYDPIEDFLCGCSGQWDGRDHIRALARTVPTTNPYWIEWFYTWFLGMVDQWWHRECRLYGNSAVPLLISRQGYNKSTFCRRLIPPQLQWGYHDSLVLAEKRQVLQAMSQFLLVNLDEFNQITPQVQQGFLKNLLQLPTVKVKRPYGSSMDEMPRLASFIATSNQSDVLADPSGSRRFLGVELSGPIDVSVLPNYTQLYAQALEALRHREKTYFDAAQTKLIMSYNQRFQLLSPAQQYFNEYFAPAQTLGEGEYMSAAAIFSVLKAHVGSLLKVANVLYFGRELRNVEGIKFRRTHYGTEYLVKRK